MNKNNKTFAEILKQHTELAKLLGDIVEGLISEAKKAGEAGNEEKKERLLVRAEKYVREMESVLQDFELNYQNELKTLESLF